MNLSGVGNSGSITDLTALYGAQVSRATSSSTISAATSATEDTTGKTDSLSISKPAEMFSKLEQLKASDPEKFKQVVTDIASKLKSAAEKQSGPAAAMLSDLAGKFENVAKGGDLSQLKPPNPPNFAGGARGAAGQRPPQGIRRQVDHGKHDQGVKQVMDDIFAEVDKAVSA